MRFDLIDLRLFVHIIESGTITGGAARAYMTLASASQRVIGMEESLGTPLLLRAKQGVTPTEAGRTLMHHARLVLEQVERMRGELGEYGAGLQGHVRILCNTSAITEHLPDVLSSFLVAHPRVSVDLEERSSAEIVDAVRAGHCDIGIVSDAADVEGLRHFVFRRDDLVLVVPRGHGLSRRRRIALGDILDCEFVGLAQESPLQELVAMQARRLGRQLFFRVRVRSFEAVCRMVEKGVGVGIVPQAAADRCAASMKIGRIAIGDAWAARRLLACVRREDDLALNARRMLDHLLAAAPAEA